MGRPSATSAFHSASLWMARTPGGGGDADDAAAAGGAFFSAARALAAANAAFAAAERAAEAAAALAAPTRRFCTMPALCAHSRRRGSISGSKSAACASPSDAAAFSHSPRARWARPRQRSARTLPGLSSSAAACESVVSE